MKISMIAIIGCVGLAVAGCQSTKPLSPEQQARQAEYDRENDRVAKADCALVEVINQRRTQAKAKPLHAPDCAYLRKKDTLVGYNGNAVRLPNFAFNGIPIPIGAVVALGQAAEKAGNQERARKAQVPATLKSEDGAIVFRKMVMRGYKEDEVAAVANTAAFSGAVAATARGRRYLASGAAR